jgi:N-acetylglucosamine malate deacetylase 2
LCIQISSCDIYNSFNYYRIENAQDLNVPRFVDTFQNKNALFIFPHTDDEVFFAGTIDLLKQNGWKISLLTLTIGQPSEKSYRIEEWKNSCNILSIDHTEIHDLLNNSWKNVKENKIEFWYEHEDSIKNIIENKIAFIQPSLVFSYDTFIGNYGHPEHRLASIFTHRVIANHQQDSAYSVKLLLNSTMPEALEMVLYRFYEPHTKACKFNKNEGLLDPDISFDIAKHWNTKRNAALAYKSQTHTLKKLFVLPDDKDTTTHFKAFPREYYNLFY